LKSVTTRTIAAIIAATKANSENIMEKARWNSGKKNA